MVSGPHRSKQRRRLPRFRRFHPRFRGHLLCLVLGLHLAPEPYPLPEPYLAGLCRLVQVRPVLEHHLRLNHLAVPLLRSRDGSLPGPPIRF